MTLPVIVPIGNQMMCEIPTKTDLSSWKIGDETTDPFFFLLVRGNCSYARKIRNSQIVGASGVIIADRQDKYLEPDDIMPNDGSGADISIPSMMIGKDASKKLYDILIKDEKKGNKTIITSTGQTVLAEMAWHKRKLHKRAYLDLWHSPIDTHTKEFLANFSKVAIRFDTANVDKDGDNDPTDEQNRLRFQERPILLDGDALGCKGHDGDGADEACSRLCTNGGRYCHVSHLHIDGKDIVKEALRRMCIRKHYSSEAIYWQYMFHFAEYCWDSDYYSNNECVIDAYKHSGVDADIIKSCIEDSGGVDDDKDNTELASSLATQKKLGIIKSPTVMINSDRALIMFGGVTPANVLIEVCDSFPYGEKPHVCYVCAACGDPVACATRTPMRCDVTDGKEPEQLPVQKKKKKSHWGKWFFGFVLIGCGVGGYLYYKKHLEGGDGDGYSYSLQDAFLAERE